MARRNKHFRTREPFHEDSRLLLSHADGPFRFLNPTRAHFSYPLPPSKTPSGAKPEDDADEDGSHETPDCEQGVPAKDVRFLWRSRDNRKGRHTLLVQRPLAGEEARFQTPRKTSDPREVLKVVIRTFTCFPYWDISWLVAFIFTWGSVVWVINAFFSWLPLAAPSTEFPTEVAYGGGITAFIGAILFFETGSILLVFEAINANNSGCFGWALVRLLSDENGTHTKEGDAPSKPKEKLVANFQHCRHHHQNRSNLVGKHSALYTQPEEARPADPTSQVIDDGSQTKRSWRWFPTLTELRTHYLHELGFLAGCSQLFGATVFGVSGFTALPGIQNHLTTQWRLNAAYWIPQVIGGSGFIVSSTLYLLETQRKWYIPAPKVLGWHIAFWNLVGAFGFTLCGALGMAYGNSGAQYQAGLATFWGSWAFLIGSYLQLYESLNKHPVEEVSSKQDFESRR